MRSYLTFLLSFFYIIVGYSQNYHSPVKGNYPIVAWYSLDDNHGTEDNYKMLADAGFNVSLAFFSWPDKMKEGLAIAKSYGIKVIVSCQNIKSPLVLTDLLKKDNGFGLYYVSDEPSCKDFPIVSSDVDTKRMYDDKHMSYINLLPNYASSELMGCDSYDDYIEKFIIEVKPDFISYDNYPFVDNVFRKGYYENLELISNKCKKNKLSFWGFVRTGVNKHYSEASIGQLSFQVNCNLAYGAKGIQYFTYATPDGMDSAILDADYKPTSIYYSIKEVNKKIKWLYKIIGNAEVIDVWNSEKKSNDIVCDSYKINASTLSESGFLFSIFAYKKNKYLFVVNKDYDKEQSISFRFNCKAKQLTPQKRKQKGVFFSSNVPPGDCLIFKL